MTINHLYKIINYTIINLGGYMNRKGFTLIELLAIIVVIALIGVLASPSIIDMFNNSKDKMYNILIDNIKTAGQNYYQECEYNDNRICTIENNSVNVTIGTLVEYGFLKNDGSIVKNPDTGKSLNNCSITITKSMDEKYNVTFTYNISDIENGSCEEEID